MTEMKSTKQANVPRLLTDCMSQVAEVERSSEEVLHLIAGGSASPDFVHKVLRLSDTLQAAAKKADLGYKHATSVVDCKGGRGLTFQERRQHAEQVLDSVRGISGLEVICVDYPPSACNLVEQPIASKGVMRAAVGLAGKGVPTPVTAAVFGPNETGSGKDAWGTSEYLVFRRVAAVAMRVLKHYQQQADGNQAPNGRPLRDLLLWLCSYRDLFTKPCDALNTLLVADSTRHMVPPIFRPYHRSWEELQAGASGKHSVAYHMVSAPASVL